MTEYYDLYTKDRERTGKTAIRGRKVPDGLYRSICFACIFNDQDKMLIQQRHSSKKSWANYWDVSAGGHIMAGETSIQGIMRETREEIGLDLPEGAFSPILTVHYENSFHDIYVVQHNVKIEDLTLQEKEVQAVKWASEREIEEMISNRTFMPVYREFIRLLFRMKNSKGILRIRKRNR